MGSTVRNGHAELDASVIQAESILGRDLWNLQLESPASFVDLLAGAVVKEESAEGEQEAEQESVDLRAPEAPADDLKIKGLMENLRREKHLQKKFEDDLEETREALKEQVQRLHVVLKEEDQITTIDEFEQMSGD